VLYRHIVLLQVTYEKSHLLIDLLMKIVQYLSVTGTSPFRYKGAAIQKFVELLKIVFRGSNERTDHINQLKRCFKVSCMAYMKICMSNNGANMLEDCQEEGVLYYFSAPVSMILCYLIVLSWCQLQVHISACFRFMRRESRPIRSPCCVLMCHAIRSIHRHF
jgi:hypothetical protein